ncbi:MAG TPA: nuclear transport factor 2 family protein [Gemmataceae bacterium]|jgi:uncharacterized protein (TIGR02246 family)|nr:nuclear transport factor 2 family protein [Gemmataceae bacterium]
MRTGIAFVISAVLVVGLVTGLVTAKGKVRGQAQPQAAPAQDQAQGKAKDGREADEAAIRKQSRAFTRAFTRGDAKAIAGLCTAGCEYYDGNSGEAFRGRAAIEKSFAALFTEHPKSKVNVDIHAIRFLGRDTAVETGLVQVQLAGPTLPSSSHYRVLHVREDGRWHVAMIEERGAEEDKLEDLGWLVGSWVLKSKDREARLTFAWNEQKTRILCDFAIKEEGRLSSSGRQVIGWDPQRGQLRSWNMDDEGGHGQALWSRDGHQWVQHAIGVLPDGTPTAATNILARTSDNEFTWRSVERTVAGEPVPDREVVTATRVKAAK